MGNVIEHVSKINNPWSLAAFGVAAILYIVLRKRGRVPVLGWLSILILVLGAIVAAAYVDIIRIRSKDTGVYRVRVTVLGPDQIVSDRATVWSSVGGEAKRVAGGWEFDVPVAVKPTDGRMIVFAAAADSHLSGQSTVVLSADYNPSVIVQFAKPGLAAIRGLVIDDSQRGIDGATVRVVGYAADVARTSEGGQFVVSTHSAEGEQVLLRVEKEGYPVLEQYAVAGDEATTLVLAGRK